MWQSKLFKIEEITKNPEETQNFAATGTTQSWAQRTPTANSEPCFKISL